MMNMSGSGIGLIIIMILVAIVAILGLVYIILSLIDMWKAYSRDQNQTSLLFFIVSLVGIVLSGPFISLILAIVFYWNRSRRKSWMGIGLIIVSIVLAILAVITFISFGYDMNNFDNMNWDEPMMDEDYNY